MSKRILNGLHAKVFNKALLVTPQVLEPIVDYMLNPERMDVIKARELEQAPILANYDNDERFRLALADHFNVDLENSIGYIDVMGTLVNRAGQIDANCMELTSYQSLKDTLEAQISLGITKCVMRFDSGGGEAYRCFGTANAMRKMADANNVKIIAYIDGLSASASYGLTCIADEIISNPNAQVGSIGVLVQLYNDTKYLDKLGLERSFVYAGDNKIPFNKDGGFKESFIEKLQASVDKTYATFVDHVAQNRGLSNESVRATQASVYDADEALQKGLVDSIMEIEEFEEYLNSNLTSGGEGSLSDAPKLSTGTNTENEIKTGVLNMADNKDNIVELTANLEKAQAEVVTQKEAVADLQKSLAEMTVAKEQAETALATFKREAVTQDRANQLASVFGTESEKVAEFNKMFASLDDSAFTKLVGEFGATKQANVQNMAEQGHDNKPDPVVLTEAQKLAEQAKARKA